MTTREYEAMFLLDNTAATADFDGTAAQVDGILEKHGAEIVLKEKWDERKLAYEIKGHRRATYYLVYFRAPTEAIREIDQDIVLNEVVLRYLAFVLDEPIAQHIERQAADREKMAEESRKASLAGWGDRKRGDRERGDRDRGPRRERARPEEAATASAGATPEGGSPPETATKGGSPPEAATTTEKRD